MVKIGVNEKCSCGSGKKYKKCCMWTDEKLKDIKNSINKRISKLSEEEINEENKQQTEEYKRDYEKFVRFFNKGGCSFCHEKLDFFNPNKPCYHWLLYPRGIKKKDLKPFVESMKLFRTMAYLRWVANQERFMGNINDLKLEKDDSRILEHTIKYKNIEWAFSCAKADYSGHGSFNFPHYHFEMKIDEKPFIDFGDFHIKLKDEDLFELDVYLGKNEKIQHNWLSGAGMQDLFNLGGENLIESVRASESEENAQLHMSTIVEAKEGETISGEDLDKAMKLSKKTGRSFASCIREILPDNKTQTIISPSDSTVEIRHRGGRGKKKKFEKDSFKFQEF